jgi:hypothetical protein
VRVMSEPPRGGPAARRRRNAGNDRDGGSLCTRKESPRATCFLQKCYKIRSNYYSYGLELLSAVKEISQDQ